MVILKLFDAMVLEGKTYAKGVYKVVDDEAQAGEVNRETADALKEAYPDSVREFKDGERIENIAEWKRQNVDTLDLTRSSDE